MQNLMLLRAELTELQMVTGSGLESPLTDLGTILHIMDVVPLIRTD